MQKPTPEIKMPLVSVIIPNFNHASFLKERIDSVLAQTFQNFEIIILDDASTDNSRNIIEQYRSSPFVKEIIYNQANSGLPYTQWQKAIGKASGQWIWVAESDDIADPGFMEKMIQLQRRHTPAAILYCDSRMIFDNDNEPVFYSALKNKKRNTRKWDSEYLADGITEINETLKWNCTINNVSAVLFRRDVLSELLPLIVNYRYHGDWILYLQIALRHKIAYLPQALNTYREHAANHSKSPAFQHQSKIEHFRILDFLVQQSTVTNKPELINHFAKNYCGFGWIKEKGFAAGGVFPAFKKINPELARKLLFRMFLHKLKLG